MIALVSVLKRIADALEQIADVLGKKKTSKKESEDK